MEVYQHIGEGTTASFEMCMRGLLSRAQTVACSGTTLFCPH